MAISSNKFERGNLIRVLYFKCPSFYPRDNVERIESNFRQITSQATVYPVAWIMCIEETNCSLAKVDPVAPACSAAYKIWSVVCKGTLLLTVQTYNRKKLVSTPE
jgi:hypothetical protein